MTVSLIKAESIFFGSHATQTRPWVVSLSSHPALCTRWLPSVPVRVRDVLILVKPTVLLLHRRALLLCSGTNGQPPAIDRLRI